MLYLRKIIKNSSRLLLVSLITTLSSFAQDGTIPAPRPSPKPACVCQVVTWSVPGCGGPRAPNVHSCTMTVPVPDSGECPQIDPPQPSVTDDPGNCVYAMISMKCDKGTSTAPPDDDMDCGGIGKIGRRGNGDGSGDGSSIGGGTTGGGTTGGGTTGGGTTIGGTTGGGTTSGITDQDKEIIKLTGIAEDTGPFQEEATSEPGGEEPTDTDTGDLSTYRPTVRRKKRRPKGTVAVETVPKTAYLGAPFAIMPGASALAQALNVGDPGGSYMDKKGKQRQPVWNIESLKLSDELGGTGYE